MWYLKAFINDYIWLIYLSRPVVLNLRPATPDWIIMWPADTEMLRTIDLKCLKKLFLASVKMLTIWRTYSDQHILARWFLSKLIHTKSKFAVVLILQVASTTMTPRFDSLMDSHKQFQQSHLLIHKDFLETV